MLSLWLRFQTSLIDQFTHFSSTPALLSLLMSIGVPSWRYLSLSLSEFHDSSSSKRSVSTVGVSSPQQFTGHLMWGGQGNILRNPSEYIGLIKTLWMWMSPFYFFVFRRNLFENRQWFPMPSIPFLSFCHVAARGLSPTSSASAPALSSCSVFPQCWTMM